MAEYYGIVLHLSDSELDSIVATNKALATLSGLNLSRVRNIVSKHILSLCSRLRQPRHLNVVITCAHTDVAYILASRIALGSVFGVSEQVALHLYDEREQASALLGLLNGFMIGASSLTWIVGLKMELEDFGASSLSETRIHYDLSAAVAMADILIVLEADTQNDVEV